MSEREVRRVEVLNEMQSGRRTVAAAASVLGISERQAYRLLARYQETGGFGLVHKARGRTSNRSHNPGIRKYAVELVKTHYADFGPTLATEALEERHGIRVGRETLRRWMMADGVWLSRKQRKTFHQPRLRRESYGELVQIDGSEHRWFEDRFEPCTLLVFVDDATSRLMQLRFVPSESTESYFAALRGYLNEHGCPVAFYSDKHSVFRVVRQDTKGGQGMTQFGRALSELNIEILCANSSQAKGPCRAGEPDASGPIGEGVTACKHQRHGSRQRLSAWIHGTLQRAVCSAAGQNAGPAPSAADDHSPAERHPVSPRAALRRRPAHVPLRP